MKEYTDFNNFETFEEELNSRMKPKSDKDKVLSIMLSERTRFRNIEDMKKKYIEFYIK